MQTGLNDAQLAALIAIYRGVPADNVRTFTMPGRATFVGDASVVIVDERWARIFGRILFSKSDPPQEAVLVANATGLGTWDKTVVAALRGGGWDVGTFVDEPVRPVTTIYGSGPAAVALAKIFGVARKAAKSTTVVIGSDLAPQKD
jgi:hypothetical protein